MLIPYKVTDIRFTPSQGWMMDCYLNERCLLPISVPFDFHILYQKGFCCNEKRTEIKRMFEIELNRMRKERFVQ